MDRLPFRLEDISTAILDIYSLLKDKDFDVVSGDRVTRAAFERFLEIISEASRHIPDEPKALHPTVPWRSIANPGNHLRHAHHRVDCEILWSVYENDLPALEIAVESLLRQADGEKF